MTTVVSDTLTTCNSASPVPAPGRPLFSVPYKPITPSAEKPLSIPSVAPLELQLSTTISPSPTNIIPVTNAAVTPMARSIDYENLISLLLGMLTGTVIALILWIRYRNLFYKWIYDAEERRKQAEASLSNDRETAGLERALHDYHDGDDLIEKGGIVFAMPSSTESEETLIYSPNGISPIRVPTLPTVNFQEEDKVVNHTAENHGQNIYIPTTIQRPDRPSVVPATEQDEFLVIDTDSLKASIENQDATRLYPLSANRNIVESKSLQSETVAFITFYNLSTQSVDITWINFEGNRQLYKTLGSYDNYRQQTYVTHPWEVVVGGRSSVFLPTAGVEYYVFIGDTDKPVSHFTKPIFFRRYFTDTFGQALVPLSGCRGLRRA